jgi:hypothetical protein
MNYCLVVLFFSFRTHFLENFGWFLQMAQPLFAGSPEAGQDIFLHIPTMIDRLHINIFFFFYCTPSYTSSDPKHVIKLSAHASKHDKTSFRLIYCCWRSKQATIRNNNSVHNAFRLSAVSRTFFAHPFVREFNFISYNVVGSQREN